MSDKNWLSLFKQAQDMQSKLAEIQGGLAEKTVEVSTGGGMVKVVANGLNEIISVHIDDELKDILQVKSTVKSKKYILLSSTEANSEIDSVEHVSSLRELI